MSRRGGRAALSAVSRGVQRLMWVPVGHLALISLAGSLTPSRPRAGSPTHSFRILILAHDEEDDVARCVESVCRLAYPNDLYRAVVVADNCGDRTAERARGAGAKVWERNDAANPGKGPAIGWALDRLADEDGWDAVVLLDADGLVTTDFLVVVDRRLAEGVVALQAERRVTNADANLVARLADISAAAQCVLRPRGRARLGGSAKLVGNGIVLGRSVLRDCPWRADGLVEDFQYWLALLAQGIRPVYEAHARVSDLMPTDLASARVQRTRWEAGRAALLRHHLVEATRLSWRRRDPVLAEALFSELLMPTLSVTGGLVALAAGARWVADGKSAAGLVQAGALLGHLVLALKAAEAPRATYAALGLAPAVALWRLWVSVEALARGDDLRWERTPRRVATA